MSKELVLGLLGRRGRLRRWGLVLLRGLVRGLRRVLCGLGRLAGRVRQRGRLLLQALELELLLELVQLLLLELVLLELVQLLLQDVLRLRLQGLLRPVQLLLGEGQRLWGEGVRRRLRVRLLGDLGLWLELQELLGGKVQHRVRRGRGRRLRRLRQVRLGSHLHRAEEHRVGVRVALLAVIHLLL